jgi:hypothetical protein
MNEPKLDVKLSCVGFQYHCIYIHNQMQLISIGTYFTTVYYCKLGFRMLYYNWGVFVQAVGNELHGR